MSYAGQLHAHPGALEPQTRGGAGRGRIVVQNVNGLTWEKAGELTTFIDDSCGECSIICLSEVNVNWKVSPRSMKEMIRTRGQRHIVFAHNTRERSDKLYQPGGVAIVSCGVAAAKVIGTEVDPSGLGRWCGVKFQLKSQTLWVLVVYRPCVALGPDTVYQQQVRYLRSRNDMRDPRAAIMEEMVATVARCREDGSWMVLGGDFNEDVRQLRIPGVREAVCRYQSGPTHQRGSVPIDGFFVSHSFPASGGGISQSYAVTTSDHYAVWIDSPIFAQAEPKGFTIRRLKIGDLKAEERYLQHIRAHWDPAMSDSQRSAVMIEAEKNCRKVYTGGLQYSPKLSRAILWVRLWKLRLKRAEGFSVDVSVLIRLEQKVDADDGQLIRDMPIAEIKSALMSAQSHIKSLRRDHQNLRFQHLQALAIAGSTHVEVLIERERSKAVFRRLRDAIPSKTKRPLYMVNEGGNWKDSAESIFYSVVDENCKRFRQTHDTPLRIEPLRTIMGDLGETTAVEEILSGTFHRPNLNQSVVDLLPFLRRPEGIEDLADIFSDDSYKRGWKKMNELTGCQEPLHFAHYKILARDDDLRGQLVNWLRETYSSGSPADRWLDSTDVMIEKSPGEYRVEKLRTILLMAADFNFANKLIGRAMMAQAERLQLIPEAQYGSRRAKSASLQVLNKVLMFEICRLQLRPIGYCSTDAKACYDRIVHSFAVIAMRRFGIPKEVALCMFRTLQQMRHRVRTGFGISEQYYTGDNQDPFQGVGQGNGAGPAIWAAVSAPLFDYMNSRQNGLMMTAPLTLHQTSISCLAFVDDTDLVYGGQEGLHEDIRAGIEDQLQAWEKVLKLTGGAIVPEKSFYWTMYFVRDKLQVKSTLPELSVTDSQGVMGSVPHLLPGVARRTLGLMLNPLGDWKDQKAKLRGMMEEWSDKCRVAGLSRQDAMVELNSRVLPRILYGLEATSFSRKDCQYIMAPMLKVGLQTMGVSSTLPRDIVFGSEEFLGLGLSDMYVVQGVRHLRLLEFHGPMDTGLTGQLLRCLLEETVVQVGLPGSVFNQNFDDYSALIPQGWIKTLWRFCWEYNIQLDDWLPNIQTLRANDRFLMVEARRLIPTKDSSSLVSFNKCRRYLGAVTLADIVTGSGTHIREAAFNGTRNQLTRRPFTFTEAFPDASDWKVWQRILRKVVGSSRSFQLVPSRQLGRWFKTVEWHSYTPELEDVVYIRRLVGWSKHILVSGAARRRRYGLVGEDIDDLPSEQLYRVVLEQHPTGFFSSGFADEIDPPVEAASGLPELYLESFGILDQVFPMNGVITVCSDGSYKEDKGTASWIAVGHGCEAGADLLVPNGVQNSYRSELAGILGGLQFLDSLGPSQLPREARVLCDGKSALEVSFGVQSLLPSMEQLDLLYAIRACRASLVRKGVDLQPIHVKGHADDNRSFEELSSDEQLNVRMDARAKAFWQKMAAADWPNVGATKLTASCSVRIAHVHTSGSKLQKQIADQRIQRYWIESKDVKTEVDWCSIAIATRALKRGKGVFVTKFFSGFCGVNQWRKRWGLIDSDQCPRCEGAVETTSHLWFCEAVSAQEMREDAIDQILQWLITQGGNLRFCRTIKAVLGAIRTQGVPSLNDIPEEYREAVAAQIAIGWDEYLKGCWAVEWRERLKGELEAKQDNRRSERMIASIIERLWETSWDLWLGRNAAVYPAQALSAEGELLPVGIRPTRLCRRQRRSRIDLSGRACMSKWLAGGR